MSSTYDLEPRTHGRIILQTSKGPIEIALWANEAPRAVRSVVAHALSGYYDGTVFHDVEQDTVVRGGDPTRTGDGGEAAVDSACPEAASGARVQSSSPRRIPVESHGRLKFRRRGIVALLGDEDGMCRSQFFISLKPAPWLDGKHTIFGHVDGQTIFNAVQIGSVAADSFSDHSATVLHSIEVVVNPCKDLQMTILKPTPEVRKPEKDASHQGGKKAIKNRALLSFGGDDGEEDDSDDSGAGSEEGRERNISDRSNVGIEKSHALFAENGGDIGGGPKDSPLREVRVVRKRESAAKNGNVGKDDEFAHDCREVLATNHVAKRQRVGGMISSYDLLSTDAADADRGLKGAKQRGDTQRELSQGSNAVGRKAPESEESSELARKKTKAAAELEAARLKAELLGDPTLGLSSNGEEAQGEAGLPAVQLPNKYAGLRRGVHHLQSRQDVLGGRSGSRLRGGESEGRTRVLKERVALAVQGARPLVFRGARADDGGDTLEDYEVVDPLEGMRGRNQAPPRRGAQKWRGKS